VSDPRLCWLPATELAALIRRRKVSPVEVVDAVLDRIERINPRLNAFVTLTAEQARREAKAAEREILHQAALAAARTHEEVDKLNEELRRDQERLAGDRDRKIAEIRGDRPA